MFDSPPRSPVGSSLRAARWCLAAFCALTAPYAVPAIAGLRAGSEPVPLSLQWEIAPVSGAAGLSAETREADAHALLTLTNPGPDAWPAAGWALYFNCLSGVRSGVVDGSFEIEQLVGTWYRIRPTQAFGGLAAGASVTMHVEHGERPFNVGKAPIGPYMVLDGEPEVGRALREFRALPPAGAGTAGEVAMAEAEALYRRYADTVNLPTAEVPPVFPTPRQVQRLSGSLHWSVLPRIEAAKELAREVALAREYLRPYLANGAAPAGALPLRLRVAAIAGQDSPESYELEVDPARAVIITGRSPAGVARGLSTLRELLPPRLALDGVDVPAIRIADAPRFAYRGLLLDVARNFQPKDVVMRVIDLMARSKLNVLHLHLTDDEGWRLPIDGLPELTTVGARRAHTLTSAQFLPPAYGSGPALDDPRGSGHVSHADYIAILRYAAARHIEVIPEIEMPGHARAAVMAMEARARGGDRRFRLADPQDASRYRSAQQYTDNVMNPGLESTYAFIERVVAQVAALHRAAGVPLRTLHMGGDELPGGAWQASPAVLALMRRERLASRDAVWEYFYGRVTAILDRRGVKLGGWEELGAQRRAGGRLVPNPRFLGRGATLYVWNNVDGAEDLANRLANAGYDTVFAPATRLYLDMAHMASPAEPGTNWAAFTDLEDVFDYEPFDSIRLAANDPAPLEGREALAVDAREHVRGIEGTLFSETVRDAARLEYLLMPRLLALAERAWAPQPQWARAADAASAARLHDAEWSVFANQLGQRVLPRLDAERTGIAYRIAPPGLHRAADGVHVNQQLPGFALRYALDGSEPDAHSAVAGELITAAGELRVAAFSINERAGRASHVDRVH